jgi:type IV pilus assembly protein PilY1
VFATRYNSGNWSGDLIAYPLNLDTGQVNLQDPVWDNAAKCTNPDALIDTAIPPDTSLGKRGCSAQVRLNERNFSTSPRFIASYSCSGTEVACDGVQFQPDGASADSTLSTSETALLNTPSSTDAAAVIAYLRGDRSGETSDTYRGRTAMLGDIINAEPVIVREPNFGYTDVGYRDFATDKANRRKVVYQGANDGMLHAFDADDATELWAYVPRFVLGTLNELTRKGYTHKFYVDGNATAGDVDFLRTDGATSTATTSDWHSILVGSLGKGGRGYYALDITDPVPASEAAAAAKVLWEFPNETNKNTVLEGTLTIDQAMGFSFGRPLIVKTTKGWVVVVTSGYNNGTTTGGNGRGYVFVLNAKTGALIRAIKASIGGTDAVEGSAATPSGLAQITPVLENALFSGRINHLYGGDNLGNLWRFDLSDANSSNWSATKVTRLVDDNGNAQPITTKPEVAKLVLGASEKRMVFVGTGRYLGNSDVATTQVQTMYGLLENLAITGNNTVIDPLRDNLVEQVLTANEAGTERSFLTTAAVDLSAKKGWYVDMPATGERINTNPVLVRGVLVFTSNIPTAQVCTFGGTAWFNAFNFRTGARVAGAGDNAPSSYSLGAALASRTVAVKAKDGVHGLTQKTNIQIDSRKVPVGGIGTASRRVSWKEVVDSK